MPTHILDTSNDESFRLADRIFLGEGLFETIRVVEDRACYPSLHWQRMHKAAKTLGIPFDLSCEKWCEQLVHRIQMDKISSGAIKVILSGGCAPRGLDAQAETSFIVFQAFTYQIPDLPLSLMTAPWLRDAHNPIYQLKSVNYLESIMARRRVIACGADDALYFNQDHHATETTIANLFIIKDDQILTPKLSDGLLAGITRARLLSLCKRSDMRCIERSIDRSLIAAADAIFVTNALQGIRLVNLFDGKPVPVHHPLLPLLRQQLATDDLCWV